MMQRWTRRFSSSAALRQFMHKNKTDTVNLPPKKPVISAEVISAKITLFQVCTGSYVCCWGGPVTIGQPAHQLTYNLTFLVKGWGKQLISHANTIDTDQPGSEVIKLFSCSTQLSTKFILLINIKMPTIVGILTFTEHDKCKI